MKVQAIKYAMLRKTEEFENDRVEVTVELERGDAVGDAVREAKRICEAALQSDEIVPAHATFEDAYELVRERPTAPMARVERNGRPSLKRRRRS